MNKGSFFTTGAVLGLVVTVAACSSSHTLEDGSSTGSAVSVADTSKCGPKPEGRPKRQLMMHQPDVCDVWECQVSQMGGTRSYRWEGAGNCQPTSLACGEPPAEPPPSTSDTLGNTIVCTWKCNTANEAFEPDCTMKKAENDPEADPVDVAQTDTPVCDPNAEDCSAEITPASFHPSAGN